MQENKLTPMDFLQLKHLDGEQKTIAEIVGIEAYRKLVANFGGEQVYIAKSHALLTKFGDNVIKSAFNGKNHKEICSAFGISILKLGRILRGS